MKIDRMLRVNEMMRRELGSLIERDLSNYLPALLTVTQVKTSPDLHEADVYVSVLGTAAQREAALELLGRHRKEFQAQIAHRVKLKFTPVLKFRLDLTIEKACKVLAIINELNLAAEPENPGPGPGAGSEKDHATTAEDESDDPAAQP